ncbi:hypothetical protein DMC61_40060 [Amycolatopsis sp. WAC 04169]|nr:hypothetical protein DMC61_40060 [Amycolatopsis sp. WAC 04169]
MVTLWAGSDGMGSVIVVAVAWAACGGWEVERATSSTAPDAGIGSVRKERVPWDSAGSVARLWPPGCESLVVSGRAAVIGCGAGLAAVFEVRVARSADAREVSGPVLLICPGVSGRASAARVSAMAAAG